MQNPYAQSIFKKPKTQTNSLGLQQSPPIHEPTPSKKKYKRALRINNSEPMKYLLTPLSFFSCNFQKTIMLPKKPCRILNSRGSNHVQRSNHPNRSTHCCCIPSIQGSSLHCESGDPKHQPGDLDQRNRGFRELPCLRQLNSLKRAFPVVIVIWSRQTLTTTRRAPKPYYCIELQKKNCH